MTVVYLGVIAITVVDLTPWASSPFFIITRNGGIRALLIFLDHIDSPYRTIAASLIIFGGHSMETVLHTAEQVGGFFTGHQASITYFHKSDNLTFEARLCMALLHGTAVLLTIAYAVLIPRSFFDSRIYF